MTREEMDVDRYYDSMLEKHYEEEKVPLEEFNEMKELADRRQAQLETVLEYIRQNDCAGAYEFLVSEGIA